MSQSILGHVAKEGIIVMVHINLEPSSNQDMKFVVCHMTIYYDCHTDDKILSPFKNTLFGTQQ